MCFRGVELAYSAPIRKMHHLFFRKHKGAPFFVHCPSNKDNLSIFAGGFEDSAGTAPRCFFQMTNILRFRLNSEHYTPVRGSYQAGQQPLAELSKNMSSGRSARRPKYDSNQ